VEEIVKILIWKILPTQRFVQTSQAVVSIGARASVRTDVASSARTSLVRSTAMVTSAVITCGKLRTSSNNTTSTSMVGMLTELI